MKHIARKRFGQNFLHDSTVMDSIIASLNIQKQQHWVEIGPGQGALTQPLLNRVSSLDVIELDRDLVKLLEDKLKSYAHLRIHSADALRFDFSSLAQNGEKLHVIGNLPYNISTPLLFHLLENAPCIASMHFMLQKEVVERLCAEPNSKQYGRLSVMMGYYCETEHLFDVPPECFDPVPQVTSAIIRLIPHSQPPVNIENMAQFNRIVTEAFSQRRKTIRNSLSKSLTEEMINSLGINSTARAENLTLEEFAALSNAIV